MDLRVVTALQMWHDHCDKIRVRWVLIYFYGYTESPSYAVLTTKRTKDTKRDFKFILFCLRVLRGEIIIGRIQLKISR
mgnify:CR=1 FL=1